MKNLLLRLITILVLTFNSSLVFAVILNNEETKELIYATILDEFISAVNNDPDIYYNNWGTPIYFSGDQLSQATGIAAIYLSDMSFYNTSAVPDIITNQTESQIYYADNEYYNRMEYPVEMTTSEFSETYSGSQTTTTTSGWASALELSLSINGVGGVKTVLSVNGSSSEATTTAHSTTYTAKFQRMDVPPGCIGHIINSFSEITQSGTYKLYGKLNSDSIATITTRCCGIWPAEPVTGSALVYDIINKGAIPQNHMSVRMDPKEIRFVGAGVYDSALTGIKSYSENYAEYPNGDPCNVIIPEAIKKDSSIHNLKPLKNGGFSYEYYPKLRHKNLSYKKPIFKEYSTI